MGSPMGDGSSYSLQTTIQNLWRCTQRLATQQQLKINNSRVVQVKLNAFILGALNKLEKITAGWLSIPTDCLCASGNQISYATPAASLAGKCCSRESSQLKIPSRKITPEKNLINALFWPQLWRFPCCKAKSTTGKRKHKKTKTAAADAGLAFAVSRWSDHI